MRGSTRRTYDQVNDVHDTRVPIYNEDAFQYGILFKAKVREQLWGERIVVEVAGLCSMLLIAG